MMAIPVMRMGALRPRHARHDAAAPARAILHAGKQALPIRRAASRKRRRRVIRAGRSCGLLSVVVCRVEAELGLDRSAVDSIFVQTLPDLPGELHPLVTAGRGNWEVHLDVQRGNEARVVELPDVDVVATDYTLQVLDIFPYLLEVDVLGRCLEQDLGSCKSEWDG